MKTTSIPKTWADVARHPAVFCVEKLLGEDVRYWIYLKDGYTAASDPGSIHHGNGRTVREAIEDVFPVRECRCPLCVRR